MSCAAELEPGSQWQQRRINSNNLDIFSEELGKVTLEDYISQSAWSLDTLRTKEVVF